MDPIVVPIQDSIDLHTFRPREVPGLLTDYFQACRQKDIYSVRVVHGKGRGILRQRVHALLNKHPLVAAYTAAPGSAGGWGATLVELKRPKATRLRPSRTCT